MNPKLLALTLLLIIAGAGAGYVATIPQFLELRSKTSDLENKTNSLQTEYDILKNQFDTLNKSYYELLAAQNAEPLKVGLFYYPWYEGTLGVNHWNGTKNWTIVDRPLLDWYNCSDETLLMHQISWMKYAGIDFVFLSWWGPGNVWKTDTACKTFFEVARSYYPELKICLMVEAFSEDAGPSSYNFTAIAEYVEANFLSKYNDQWMRLNSKPLLCWYNGYQMTGGIDDAGHIDGGWQNIPKIRQIDTFECRILGHNDYVDWWFCYPHSKDPRSTPHLSSKDGMICVEPRYDNQYLELNGQQPATFDENLTEGLYDSQWAIAVRLARGGEVHYVTIYSWNEYHERSQIEPHIDKSGNNVTSLFLRTKNYIDWIKNNGP